jgi:hypothetical protein
MRISIMIQDILMICMIVAIKIIHSVISLKMAIIATMEREIVISHGERQPYSDNRYDDRDSHQPWSERQSYFDDGYDDRDNQSRKNRQLYSDDRYDRDNRDSQSSYQNGPNRVNYRGGSQHEFQQGYNNRSGSSSNYDRGINLGDNEGSQRNSDGRFYNEENEKARGDLQGNSRQSGFKDHGDVPDAAKRSKTSKAAGSVKDAVSPLTEETDEVTAFNSTDPSSVVIALSCLTENESGSNRKKFYNSYKKSWSSLTIEQRKKTITYFKKLTDDVKKVILQKAKTSYQVHNHQTEESGICIYIYMYIYIYAYIFYIYAYI